MNTSTLAATALLGTALLTGVSAANASTMPSPHRADLVSYGEFEVGNGDKKAISLGKKDHHYRICVDKADHKTPVEVTYDGKEASVSPGDCLDVEAARIDVAPGAKLAGDEVLVGHFRHLRE